MNTNKKEKTIEEKILKQCKGNSFLLTFVIVVSLVFSLYNSITIFTVEENIKIIKKAIVPLTKEEVEMEEQNKKINECLKTTCFYSIEYSTGCSTFLLKLYSEKCEGIFMKGDEKCEKMLEKAKKLAGCSKEE